MKVKTLLHVVVGEWYSEDLGLRESALSDLVLIVGCVCLPWAPGISNLGLLYANFSVADLGRMPSSV